MAVLETLCVAVVNYFTSAPDFIQVTKQQFSVICNLMELLQLNLSLAIDLIYTKHTNPPPCEPKRPNTKVTLPQTNEKIVSILKMICRITDKRLQSIPTKQLLKMKNLGLNKQQFMQLALKPLFQTVNTVLKQLHQLSFE